MKPLETLLSAFVELHPEEAARAFEALDSAEAQRSFQTLPMRVAVPLLERLSPHVAGPLVGQLENERIRELLTGMSPRSASVVAHQLDAEKREEVLTGLPVKVALALREIISGVERRVVMKELVAGLINGISIAIVTGMAVFIWQMFIEQSGSTKSIGLSVVIFLAMIINMAAAALSGAVIPLVLRALGRDPAQSSSIFLTTVTDIVGFSSFLGFAVLFLPMLK